MSTEGIVTRGRWVADTIRFSTRLDPHKGINESRRSRGCRSGTETGSLDVTPITPLKTETLDSVATSVNDGVARHSTCGNKWAEDFDVALLVMGLVILAIGSILKLSWVLGVCVPSGYVSGDSENLLGRAGSLIYAAEAVCTRF